MVPLQNETVGQFARENEISAVALFGSAARSSSDPGDLDLAWMATVESAAKINSEIGQSAGVPATDYYSSFFVVAQAGWISSELARTLAELASLSNVLVHRYQQALDELHQSLLESVPSWRDYVAVMDSRIG